MGRDIFIGDIKEKNWKRVKERLPKDWNWRVQFAKRRKDNNKKRRAKG